MRVQQGVIVFLLSGFFAVSAAAFDIKPGEWEMETKISGGPPGMVMPKIKVCIAPEQAKAENMNKMPKECKVNFTEKKSNLVSYEAVCDGQGGKTEIKGTVKKVSDGEIVTDVAMTMHDGGQKRTHQTTTRQKYIGPTCSKEAMPSGAR
ncbi:MAG: DUF3617 domain-containing protein [Burkholderiales bacterium]|jgi:hypothetical protein|nr:DUF3617 domain-containing protein [Burkholderiales bacterium]